MCAHSDNKKELFVLPDLGVVSDPQRGQVWFPCLLSRTLSSAQTAVAQGGALARVLLQQQQQRSHGLGRAGSRACNVCGYLERQLLCEVCWE